MTRRPVIRTVCSISTVPKHPRGQKTRRELETELAVARAGLRPQGWAAGARERPA